MKSILREIRQQPEHIRHIFMWVLVVITFSMVGFVWFRSTTKQFVALLHPEQAKQERVLAAEQDKPRQFSPFGTIFDSARELRANISELLFNTGSDFEVRNGVQPQPQVPPNELPLSD